MGGGGDGSGYIGTTGSERSRQCVGADDGLRVGAVNEGDELGAVGADVGLGVGDKVGDKVTDSRETPE